MFIPSDNSQIEKVALGIARSLMRLAKPISGAFRKRVAKKYLDKSVAKKVISGRASKIRGLSKRNLKGKAIKGAIYGGTGYGLFQGAKYIQGTHDPYNPNFNYNRHIRQGVTSGEINPHDVDPNTLRSVIMKTSSVKKEALIGGLAMKMLPTLGFSALSMPGAISDYKGKLVLPKNKLRKRPAFYGAKSISQF